eukprot:jgi/Bigna1/137350/aug1.38_g12058
MAPPRLPNLGVRWPNLDRIIPSNAQDKPFLRCGKRKRPDKLLSRFADTPNTWKSRTRHGTNRNEELVHPVRSENRPKRTASPWHVKALHDYCSSNITCTEAAVKQGKSPQAFNHWLKKKETTPERRDGLRNVAKNIDLDDVSIEIDLDEVSTETGDEVTGTSDNLPITASSTRGTGMVVEEAGGGNVNSTDAENRRGTTATTGSADPTEMEIEVVLDDSDTEESEIEVEVSLGQASSSESGVKEPDVQEVDSLQEGDRAVHRNIEHVDVLKKHRNGKGGFHYICRRADGHQGANFGQAPCQNRSAV